MSHEEATNVAETLAREMKKPELLADHNMLAAHHSVVAIPPGWNVQQIDTEKLQPSPRRKTAKVKLLDVESYAEYLCLHGDPSASSIWAQVDYQKGIVAFTAILNDHGGDDDEAGWRDHQATFKPAYSYEWATWFGKNTQPMGQVEFAEFIERNLKDIATVDGLPTGTQMLAMATDLEITQDAKFKSFTRLQSGGVRLEFVSDDDDETAKRMEVFNRFAIGVPVFWNGDAYRVEARLKYRVAGGKVSFWFELVRPDVTLEVAAKTVIEQIKQKSGGLPFFFGEPGI